MEYLIDKGISFQMETPEKYKLFLQKSSRALGKKKFNYLYLLFDLQNIEEIYGGVLLWKTLNIKTPLLKKQRALRGNKFNFASLWSVDKASPFKIIFATRRQRELRGFNVALLSPSQRQEA